MLQPVLSESSDDQQSLFNIKDVFTFPPDESEKGGGERERERERMKNDQKCVRESNKRKKY